MTDAAGLGRALLHGAGLPARWAGADRFTVLELDGGDGATLVEALRAWHGDPARCARLHWAALAPSVVPRDALAATLAARPLPGALAGPLLARWPAGAPGVHRIELAGGRIVVSIAVGAVRTMLPGRVPHADALLLPLRAGGPVDAAVLRTAAAMLVADGLASVAAADAGPDAASARPASAGSAAGAPAGGAALERAADTLAALSAAGLEVREAPADGEPRAAWRGIRRRGRAAPARVPTQRGAIVVGGGLAGAATSAALARRGWRVVRIESGGALEDAGSLQPVLAQHPSVTPDDAPLSRLTRTATLLAGAVAGADALRPIGRVQCLPAPVAAHAVGGLPSAWVRAVDADEASALAGVRLRSGGLWLPLACSADPRALHAAWTPPGVEVVAHRRVGSLRHDGHRWHALSPDGATIDAAPVVVLACGAGGLDVRTAPTAPPRPLDALLGPAGLRRRPGTTTIALAAAGQRPRCIVGGDGHVVPIDAHRLLLGPAGSPEDDDPPGPLATRTGAAPGPADPVGAEAQARRRAWHRWARRLVDAGGPPSLSPGIGGLRLSARDHLPIAGPLADPAALAAGSDAREPAPALPGLWIATAFGGRGLLWSVLCAELIAAGLDAEPAPIERALARHLSPDRFLARALRRTDTAG